MRSKPSSSLEPDFVCLCKNRDEFVPAQARSGWGQVRVKVGSVGVIDDDSDGFKQVWCVRLGLAPPRPLKTAHEPSDDRKRRDLAHTFLKLHRVFLGFFCEGGGFLVARVFLRLTCRSTAGYRPLPCGYRENAANNCEWEF